MTDQAHWTTPPHVDSLLVWYFNDSEADCGFGSTHQAFVAMAQAGIAGGGTTQSDDRLVRRGIVGVKHELHESKAGKARRAGAALAQLSEFDRNVLRAAYRRLEWKPEVEQRLGWLCGVMLVDPENEAAWKTDEEHARSIGEWLMRRASKTQLLRAHGSALALLRESWNKWADARGRRPRLDRHASREDAMVALDERERLAGR